MANFQCTAILVLFAVTLGAYAATTWTVMVKGEGPAGTMTFWFYPTTLTINEGDSVVFQWGANAPGLVAIGNNQPAALGMDTKTGHFSFAPSLFFPITNNMISDPNIVYSSGLIIPGGTPVYPTWNTTFVKAGTYPVADTLHVPGMTATIIVQAPGSPYPQTQAQITAAAQAQLADQLKCADNAIAYYKLDRTVPYSRPHPNGVNKIWSIWAAYGDFWNFFSVPRFYPSTITIKRGDVLVFNNADVDLHLVGVGDSSAFPGLLVIDPKAGAYFADPYVFGIPGPFTGTGFVSSGLMVPSVAPGSTSYTWNVTMNAVGTFSMICAIHDGAGMHGTVTVTA